MIANLPVEASFTLYKVTGDLWVLIYTGIVIMSIILFLKRKKITNLSNNMDVS